MALANYIARAVPLAQEFLLTNNNERFVMPVFAAGSDERDRDYLQDWSPVKSQYLQPYILFVADVDRRGGTFYPGNVRMRFDSSFALSYESAKDSKMTKAPEFIVHGLAEMRERMVSNAKDLHTNIASQRKVLGKYEAEVLALERNIAEFDAFVGQIAPKPEEGR